MMAKELDKDEDEDKEMKVFNPKIIQSDGRNFQEGNGLPHSASNASNLGLMTGFMKGNSGGTETYSHYATDNG